MADSPRGIDHTDSIDSNDGPKQPDKKKSRRPASEYSGCLGNDGASPVRTSQLMVLQQIPPFDSSA